MDEVLNEDLYNKLKKVFGSVAVYSRGERASYKYDRRSIYDMAHTKIYAKNVTGGEHYAVTCPFCKKEGKLWLSYLANATLCENGETIHFPRGLIICYRCHFNSEPEKLNAFWKMVGSGISVVTNKPREEEEYEAPKLVIPTCIPITHKDVPKRVIDYLLARNMDIQELNDIYNVMYSEDSKVLVKGVPRIIFPIIQNGEICAWQGRCLDDDVKRWGVPKYQFPSGVKIKWMLYNSDNARWQPYAIITEGITDVIACGKAAVATFGKTISQRQLAILTAYWGAKGVIRIPDMDDPEAYTVAKKELTAWNAAGMFKKGAHMVIPPRGKDPGDLSRDTILKIIKEQTGIAL